MLAKTSRYSRHTYGDDGVFGKRNIVSTSFSATDLGKAANASTTALLTASATSGSSATTLTPTAQPSVPRAITITTGGTATDIKAAAITVTGKNSEGKTITDTVTPTVDTAGTLTTTKAFASVTSVSVPAQDGNGVTVAIGTSNNFGINQRSASTAVAKIMVIAANGSATLEDASASNFSSTVVENNTVTPTTTPDGAVQFRLYVFNYNWHVDPTNGNPNYGV